MSKDMQPVITITISATPAVVVAQPPVRDSRDDLLRRLMTQQTGAAEK